MVSKVREWPWRWIVPVVGMVILGLVVVVLGLLSDSTTTEDGPRADEASPTETAPPSATTPSPTDSETTAAVPALPSTTDPDTYAEVVATLIYSRDWQNHPADYRSALHAGLDPEYVLSSEARDEIIATLDSRIPKPWLWERIVAAKQTNTFTPETTWEPGIASDPRALEDWPRGVMVRNVQGIQTLRYLDEHGAFRTDRQSVTVTVYMVCPPARDHCTLLGVPREVER